MAYRTIAIDDEVLNELKDRAAKLNIPFSSPNNIIRMVLKLKPLKGPRHQ